MASIWWGRSRIRIRTRQFVHVRILGSGDTWPTAVHGRRPQLLELRARRRPGEWLLRGARTDNRW